MRQKSNKFCLNLVAVVCCTGCNKDDDSTSSSRALKNHTYNVSTPYCLSTGTEPEYPDIERAAALWHFRDIVAQTWQLEGDTLIVQLSDSDCSATMRREVHTNSNQLFSLKQKRIVELNPSECQLTLQAGGPDVAPVTVTATQTVSLQTFPAPGSTDEGIGSLEDIPWTVRSNDSTIQLTTLGKEPFRTIWTTYGCSEPDALAITLVPAR